MRTIDSLHLAETPCIIFLDSKRSKMILLVATPRLSSRVAHRTLYIIRSASTSSAKDHAPEPATIQITTQDFPGKVPSGHFKYDRFDRYSWDNRFKGNEWTK